MQKRWEEFTKKVSAFFSWLKLQLIALAISCFLGVSLWAILDARGVRAPEVTRTPILVGVAIFLVWTTRGGKLIATYAVGGLLIGGFFWYLVELSPRESWFLWTGAAVGAAVGTGVVVWPSLKWLGKKILNAGKKHHTSDE